jgi:transcriptional regulator with GAF, ATPase, and Fis domain
MVKVDCSALPPTLIESELFGREKGAYTGALTSQVGRFEFASGSTLFLDEIGELTLELQAKLLRVLQDGEFERLGSPKPVKVDVRVIAATNRDLAECVNDGSFRQDLYYRLKVFPIELPSLRDRPEDIPLLTWAFVRELERKMAKKIETIPKKTMEALLGYDWPGNVRELKNVVEQALIISTGSQLEVQMPGRRDVTMLPTLKGAEHRHILAVLQRTGWRIKGPGGAAELLGMKPSTLYTTMLRLGIPTKHGKDGIPS